MERSRIFLLKVLIFAIPFQQWEPFNSPYANITFVAFFAYFLMAMISGKLFSVKALIPFLVPAVMLVGIMFYMTHKNYYDGSKIAYSEVRQLIMQLVFFLFVANEIRRRPGIENELLHAFLASIVFMCLAFLLNIGVEYKMGRLKIFQANSNAIGLWFVIGIFILIKFLHERIATGVRKNIYIFLVPVFVLIIALTGSRGAVVLFFVGVVVFLYALPMKAERKLPLAIAGVVVLIAALLVMSQVEILRTRFLEAGTDEDLGGRVHIWKAAWPLVVNNPWFGAGASGYERHMAMFFTGDHAPHNIYLTILLYSGIVGLVFFLVLFLLIGRQAWKVNKLLGKSFYLVVFTVYIAVFFKAGGFLSSFTLWFFLSMTVGLGVAANDWQKYRMQLFRKRMEQKRETSHPNGNHFRLQGEGK